MKSMKKIETDGRSKKASAQHSNNERLLPAEVKSKTAGLAERGRFIGKKWFPETKAKS